MDRKQKILGGLDLAQMVGVEIGPLCGPLVSRQDGEVLYVDHVDTPTLRAKYANDPAVNIDHIVDVDGVWGSNTLSEAIGGRQVDYVVASHVIEHVPDLLGWLNEIAEVLTERGELRLAVPDRRFTFDFLRQESRFADVLNAYLHKARAPLPIEILDFNAEATFVDLASAWRGDMDPAALQRFVSDARAIEVAQDAMIHGNYHDVHCWVFTPRSFAELMRRTALLGLHPYACIAFHDTAFGELEFQVALAKAPDRVKAAETWAHMSAQVRALPEPSLPVVEREAFDHSLAERIAGLEAERDRAQEQIIRLRAERDAAAARVSALESSTSWRISRPLRAIAERIRAKGA
jgi:SAM-dependent methyltransferase